MHPSSRRHREQPRRTLPSRSFIQPYRHKPLGDAYSSRLFQCIHYSRQTRQVVGVLHNYRIDDCPEYWALSYTWGPAIKGQTDLNIPAPCELLILDGTSAPITVLKNIKSDPYDIFRLPCVRSLQIGSNLADFLLYLNDQRFQSGNAPVQDVFFWVDAICIDQTNDLEKQSQIPLMGEIYDNA